MDNTTHGVMELDCSHLSSRDINQTIRQRLARGESQLTLQRVKGQHNIGVGITTPASFHVYGDLGYYAFAMCDGIEAHIHGNVGWGLGENLMGGLIVVAGHAGSSTAPTLRGGTIVVTGNAGPRTGIAMKGGLLIVGGNIGYMSGFMMQKGTMIVLGDAGPGLGDSMYAGRIFIAGQIADLGQDAYVESVTKAEHDELKELLEPYTDMLSIPKVFRKVVSAGTLHHFDKKERARWKTAL
ncbi:glutamate synthase [Sulfobacillus thermosulfidooxidans]|uniref:GltB/FmdC/FwdC-like GXGXG domain-containing protein n=1 Tax=Sulfobacillus thermosulfidooxidans TaxID=28034 RepID=UPI0006B58BE9|nr:glutamate synthase [Sulfobacillus thermosulfidooxidans]